MSALEGLALHHLAVIVTDLARSSAFYGRMFGLEPIPRPPFATAGQWLGLGAQQLHLTVNPAGNFRSGPVDTDDTHFAFRTPDFESFLAHAETMGFREDRADDDPLRMIVRRQSRAGFPQVFLMDPDRNLIEVNGAP